MEKPVDLTLSPPARDGPSTNSATKPTPRQSRNNKSSSPSKRKAVASPEVEYEPALRPKPRNNTLQHNPTPKRQKQETAAPGSRSSQRPQSRSDAGKNMTNPESIQQNVIDLIDDDDENITVPHHPARINPNNVLIKFTNINTCYILPINPYKTDRLVRLKPHDPWQFKFVPDMDSVINIMNAERNEGWVQVSLNQQVTITKEVVKEVLDGKKVPAPAVNLYLQMLSQTMDHCLLHAFRGAGKSPSEQTPHRAWAMDDTAWSGHISYKTFRVSKPYPFDTPSTTFMKMETIFVPVCDDTGLDWNLLVIHPRRKLLEIFPPSPKTTGSTIVSLQRALSSNSFSHTIQRMIADRCSRYLSNCYPEEYDVAEWGCIQTVAENDQHPPRYDDSDDAGIILLLNAELLARGLAPHTLDEQMRGRQADHRRRIAFSLLEHNMIWGPIVSST